VKQLPYFQPIAMPTPQEIQHRQSDERRVQAENAKAASARKAVLRKRLAELSQQKRDIDRQINETNTELGRL